MKYATETVSWIPVRKLFSAEQNHDDDFDECFEEFLADLPYCLKTFSSAIVKCEAKLSEPPVQVFETLKVECKAPIVGRKDNIIKVSCIHEYNENFLESRVSYSNVAALAACETSSFLEDSFTLAQLAYPGRIKFENGITYVMEKCPTNEVKGGPVSSKGTGKERWPYVDKVTLADVVDWERKLGLFENGIARTPVQRALAAFTHLICSSSLYGESLFWAMQGLEAFYCRGTGDLRRQLSEKSKIFLGDWEDKKNIVGQMYDFRSKFVHGDLYLERYGNNNWTAEVIENNESLREAVLLSIGMLTASLHKCVTEKIVNIDFDYKLRLETA